MASSAVLNATPSDADRSIATLIMAFSADPFIRWMMPEPNQYLTHFGPTLRLFAGKAFDNAAAYRSEDFMAAALWLPPSVHPDAEALGELMQTALDPALQGDVFGILEQMGESHPEEDHWYLPVIGVDPSRQGMGYGSALLTRSLEACDRAHQTAYLESTNARNLPLYERHGFRVIREIQVGNSPPIWPMLRPAR